jgi:hypothetical protein
MGQNGASDPTRTSDEVRFRAAVKGIADITSALVVVGRECAPSERLETSKASDIAHRRWALIDGDPGFVPAHRRVASQR